MLGLLGLRLRLFLFLVQSCLPFSGLSQLDCLVHVLAELLQLVGELLLVAPYVLFEVDDRVFELGLQLVYGPVVARD